MSDRNPPYSIEAEQAVLGGLMLDPRAWADVAELLGEEDFYRADHQLIWRAISDLCNQGKPADFVTLVNYCQSNRIVDDVGGISYLGSLGNDTPSAANVRAYAAIVAERAMLRSLIALGGDIAESGYRPDGRSADELVLEAQRRVLDLDAGRGLDAEAAPIGDYARAWFARFEARRSSEAPPGLPTGLRDLDHEIIGLEPGDFCVIAGAPGIGKTVLGLQLLDDVAQRRLRGLGYSLEMPREQWQNRLVCRHAKVSMRHLRDPRGMDDVTVDAVTWAMGRISQLPLVIDDTPALQIARLRARALKQHARHPLSVLVVDYLQLMSGDRQKGDSRAAEVDSISRGLKSLAKELQIPVVALAQLKRAIAERDDKRPRLADLRESGGIEMDADLVLLLYRDELYNRHSASEGIMEVNIAKQRNGESGKTIELCYSGAFFTVSDYDGPSRREREANAEPPKPRKSKNPLVAALNGTKAQPTAASSGSNGAPA